MKPLHILNGDGTAAPFSESKLADNETLIWREVMMEGPVTDNKDFWKYRGLYFAKSFKRYGESASSYFKKVIQEKVKLDKLSEYTHLTLWFEYDLFCQINLIYLLNWLAQQDISQLEISLVSPGKEQEGTNFRGMGVGSAEQIERWYQQRTPVPKVMLLKAQELWGFYTSSSPEKLGTLIGESEIDYFPHLKKAFAAHLSRFPSFKNGLNAVEQALLDIIATEKPTKFGQIFEPFWAKHPVYGLGDAQLVNCLEKLSPMIVTFNQASIKAYKGEQIFQFEGEIEITTLGEQVRIGNRDWIDYGYPNVWLGGVHLVERKPLYRWEPD